MLNHIKILLLFFLVGMVTVSSHARKMDPPERLGGMHCTVSGFTQLHALHQGVNKMKSEGMKILSVMVTPKEEIFPAPPGTRCADTTFPEGTYVVIKCSKPYPGEQVSEQNEDDGIMRVMSSGIDGEITPCQ